MNFKAVLVHGLKLVALTIIMFIVLEKILSE